MEKYEWNWFRAGRMSQVCLEKGDDIANLASLDPREWLAISMPVKGVRFDRRMLELMDTDGDGRIRSAEVLGAIDFLKSKGVNLDELFNPSPADETALADVLDRQADLAKAELSADDKAALAQWEAKGGDKAVAICGDATADADAALASVEPVIDAFFTPPEDMPLVTDEPDVRLPLKDRINPKHLEAMLDFAAKCVKPVLGDVDSIGRMDWKGIKAAFAPYRAWVAAKPVASEKIKASLVEEEKVLRYKLHLLEFLENYVNMRHLYTDGDLAVFQTGTLRIDAKEMRLCFNVESEAAHSALADKSKCCVIYLKLSRPSEKSEANICAVVTAGIVRGLYVGRNGVFYDRDGKDWEAVITKVVEAEVSLMEAFWAPWRKFGELIASVAKKFLGDRETAAQAKLESSAGSAASGGAAMASSVAAIGIGVGMMGAALASILAAVSAMTPLEMLIAIFAVILVVSLPSVILTWFRLRQRDLGAILNASGWAINRPMRFSMARARAFTLVACDRCACRLAAACVVLAALVLAVVWWCAASCCCCDEADGCVVEEVEVVETPAAQ